MEADSTGLNTIEEVNKAIKDIEDKIIQLKNRKDELIRKREILSDLIMKRESEKLASRDWSSRKFPWSEKVDEALKNIFKISKFRPLQLEAINATMSKQDTILITPTGSGKSLCYQLPALIENGVTLVVSPLISLMEDQIRGLKEINYPALMLSSNSKDVDVKLVTKALQDPTSKIKLIYVTPERLAKSKRLMRQLQKLSQQGRFSRVAIDEVQCCTVWGHSYRPDYMFLKAFKTLFPEITVIGLSASANKEIRDIQKFLNIEGCLVLKSGFNRPNLFYDVIEKPATQNDCIDLLVKLLTNRYKNQSGIIYTTTIKSCEELSKHLKEKEIRVAPYHAGMDPDVRSGVHSKWMSGKVQVVVATIAFGLGINKPDVRFVLHHSLSKSMDSYYQESGRAGRDNEYSECIILYRLPDIFKISTMVFTERNGLENLYEMVNYCLNSHSCRRVLMAEYFEESFTSNSCKEMCDHCKKPSAKKEMDVTEHCRALYSIITRAMAVDTKLTANKLIDAWYGRGGVALRFAEISKPKFEKVIAEKIIGHLLILGYLQEDFHYTPYSVITYLRRGTKYYLLNDSNHRILLSLGPEKNAAILNGDECSKGMNTENLRSGERKTRKSDKIKLPDKIPSDECGDERVVAHEIATPGGSSKRKIDGPQPEILNEGKRKKKKEIGPAGT